MNIVEPILFQCRWQPKALAICVPGSGLGSVTYAHLARLIHSVSKRAQQEGVAKGDIVALYIKDPILHSVVILGLAKLGVVTLSARSEPLPKELRLDAILTDFSDVQNAPCRKIVLDKTWLEQDDAQAVTVATAKMGDDEPCRIALTSGTTGEPKAIARSSKQIYIRTLRFQTALGSRLPTCSRIFIDMSLATGIGFSFLIHVLSRGGAAFLNAGKVPSLFEAISAYQIQALIAAPKTLAELAELSDRSSGFTGGLDVVISTGSMLTRALAERVRARLSNDVISMYGTSETGLIATAPASTIAGTEGAVGFVVPGAEIDIVDRAGNRLAPGQEGLVRIRSESVLGGYLGDPELTKARFKDDGFYPGDIGSITADGLFIISGRAGSDINLGGEKVMPERIEAELTAFASVLDAAVFPMMTPVGVQVLGSAIVWRGEADVAGLKAHMQRRLANKMCVPVVFATFDAVPRNSSGKINRARLKELAAAQINTRQ